MLLRAKVRPEGPATAPTAGRVPPEAAANPGASSLRQDRPHQPTATPVTARLYRRVKPVTDWLLAAALCVPALPLVLLAAAVVKLTSRGPALYRQSRVGLRGRVFVIYKLRSMTHDCERHSGPRWSTTGDPRITLVGGLLRRLHVDELPQLWNVLRGEMSLVGPRPERPEFLPTLQGAFADYARRHEVRPGITGLAQVQLPADSDLESVRRKLACDLYYVEHESAGLDFRLLLATGGKVLKVPFAWTGAVLWIPSWTRVQAAARRRSVERAARGPHARLSGAAGAS
jgi:lipopolysaccharide/colanic/teichoic acid biosynthesis glycosyltransferase